jgi:hypothetical protein
MTEYRYTTRRPPDKMVHKFFFNIHLKRKEIQQKMLNFKLYLSMVFLLFLLQCMHIWLLEVKYLLLPLNCEDIIRDRYQSQSTF